MKAILSSAAMIVALSGAAFAGDAAKGEKDFKKCKSCHTIKDDASGEVIFKGGKTGPNLHGIVGRNIGAYEGFKYGKSIKKLNDQVWTEELLIEYVKNPKTFLKEHTGDAKAKSKMTFKMSKPENVVAYLATFSPAVEAEAESAPAEEAPAAEAATESTETN